MNYIHPSRSPSSGCSGSHHPVRIPSSRRGHSPFGDRQRSSVYEFIDIQSSQLKCLCTQHDIHDILVRMSVFSSLLNLVLLKFPGTKFSTA